MNLPFGEKKMRSKIIFILFIPALLSINGCGSHGNDGEVKIRVQSGNPQNQTGSQYLSSSSDPCSFNFYIVASADDIESSLGSLVSTSVPSLSAALESASGAELVSPAFSTELLVPSGKSRRITAFGGLYSTCTPSLNATAYPIFGETSPMDIDGPVEVNLDANVHLGGFNVISSTSGELIRTDGSPFVTVTFNTPATLPSDSRRIIVIDKATDIYFAKSFVLTSTSASSTIGPLAPNRTYQLVIELSDTTKYVTDFQTSSTSQTMTCPFKMIHRHSTTVSTTSIQKEILSTAYTCTSL